MITKTVTFDLAHFEVSNQDVLQYSSIIWPQSYAINSAHAPNRGSKQPFQRHVVRTNSDESPAGRPPFPSDPIGANWGKLNSCDNFTFGRSRPTLPPPSSTSSCIPAAAGERRGGKGRGERRFRMTAEFVLAAREK